MGSTIPRMMRCRGRGRLAGRMRPFGNHVKIGWTPTGVNLLISLTTSRVLEGELGDDQFVILVVARQNLPCEYHLGELTGN